MGELSFTDDSEMTCSLLSGTVTLLGNGFGNGRHGPNTLSCKLKRQLLQGQHVEKVGDKLVANPVLKLT
jgi:hypothetical protein